VLGQRSYENEVNKLVVAGRKHAKEEFDEKITELKQELNIARSKKINHSRFQKMIERNNCLDKIKVLMTEKL
jgi:LPS O-antigen subunit length determinant protein (WzzB/FepE family)